MTAASTPGPETGAATDDDEELAGIRARLMKQIQDAHAEEAAATERRAAAPDHPIDATDGTLSGIISDHGSVLVDLWAPWCGPCRVVGPILEEVARERKGHLVVVKVNVDENPQTSTRYQVQGIPTMLLFQGGRLVDRVTGALPKPQLLAWLDRARAGAGART
jgi:thioredoxin 2